MKKCLLFLFAVYTLVALLTGSARATNDRPVISITEPAPSVSAQSYILMEANTGTVLGERSADSQMLIASTTKIMTALVVLENCNVNETVVIKPECVGVEGSSIYLKAGEQLTVRELLYGLMLASGNDAAEALACHTAGGIDDFAAMMNDKAEQLGMADSSFQNPHGLDAENHYSTARDMAKLTAYAMENSQFAEIVGTKSIQVAGRNLTNHNKLLWSYEGAMGVKTGYTQSAGRILVSCAEREGTRLICVTISDPDDWDDHRALYNWGFDSCNYRRLVAKGEPYASVPVVSGLLGTVDIIAEEDLCLVVDADDVVEVVAQVPKFVYAAVRAGEQAGSVQVKLNGELVLETRLLYVQSVDQDPGIPLTFWERVKWSWYRANKYGILQFNY